MCECNFSEAEHDKDSRYDNLIPDFEARLQQAWEESRARQEERERYENARFFQ